MKLLLCAALLFPAMVSVVPVFAQKSSAKKASKFTSVYTNLKTDCESDAMPAGEYEGTDPATTCKAIGGNRLRIYYSAWAAVLIIIDSKGGEVTTIGEESGTIGASGEKLEWRMADGTPFAVIMRMNKYDMSGDSAENPYTAANKKGSTMVIKGLRGYEHIDATVDGASPDANAKARSIADAGFRK